MPGGGSASPDVMVSSGVAMADGLALSGPAAHLGRPILFVTQDKVPAATAGVLQELGTLRTVVAGSAGVVSDQVLAQRSAQPPGGRPDRFATSVQVASWARKAMPVSSVVVASGEDQALVDTLSGGQFGRRRSTCEPRACRRSSPPGSTARRTSRG